MEKKTQKDGLGRKLGGAERGFDSPMYERAFLVMGVRRGRAGVPAQKKKLGAESFFAQSQTNSVDGRWPGGQASGGKKDLRGNFGGGPKERSVPVLRGAKFGFGGKTRPNRGKKGFIWLMAQGGGKRMGWGGLGFVVGKNGGGGKTGKERGNRHPGGRWCPNYWKKE